MSRFPLPPTARPALTFAALATSLLAACGGGTDDGPGADAGRLYVGYYLEDAANNPEDPLPGTLVLRLPADDGAFEGLMPFSYVGCTAGADVGTVRGMRSASTLDGQWTGAVDGVAVGGSYAGGYDAATDEFSGQYTNANGKVPVTGPGDCRYAVAAYGTWRLFGGDTVAQPAHFVVGSDGGVSPTWSWPRMGLTAYYLVRVLDEDCLRRSVTDASCLIGEAQSLLPQVRYPADFPGASPLRAGGHYLVAVHAVDARDGTQLGFSTRHETP
ncbi:hypothetical protein [Ideonella sp.]|uniref:hypothetical protein n=1 Tax=Ideonella sp. TaxID=1929293 RepID=UPI0035B0960C